MITKLNGILKQFGINLKQTYYSAKGVIPYLKNYSKLNAELKNSSEFKISSIYPNLFDRFDTAGSIPLHYFYQDLFVAQKIFAANPEKHVDIGSRIDGFVAHVAAFRKVEVFDIRKLEKNIPNVKFVRADLMVENFEIENYCDSISCLHAIEHFGLGRYGDPIDINGHLKGLNNIAKILKKNGRFYFSTPIGPQRIEFDAHRVFSLQYLLDLFSSQYELNNFSFIDDNNEFHPEVELKEENIRNNFNCNYGCGIFELTKK